ncbi:MAG: siroheme decarboxylase subunit alpha [Methanotrichaceae archaeon]
MKQNKKLDDLDRQLLDMVQVGFPLVARPFQALGGLLGISEEEVIQRTERLQKLGIIRQIGPLLEKRQLGCSGVLVALPVPQEQMDEVAEIVNEHEEISHNYLRPNHAEYNMWFTVSAREERIEEILKDIKAKTGLKQLVLPTLQIFKIGVKFEIPE